MNNSDITVISVCYNSTAVVTDMLDSVSEDTPVVLVDNASDDIQSLKKISARRNVRLVTNSINRGFGVACNQGAEQAKTKFLLFLNPDTELDAAALGELVSAAGRYPQASAFNPRIANSHGQPVFKRGSRLIPRSEKLRRGWPQDDRELPVLSGAALFVRRTAFEQVGGFDPEIFLYHEDDDFSLRLRKQVGPLMFVRASLVNHLGGESSPRSPEVAAMKSWHMARSRVYAMKKHGRPMPFLSSLFSAIRQLISPLILFSKRKRAKNFGLLMGTLSAYSDGGRNHAKN